MLTTCHAFSVTTSSGPCMVPKIFDQLCAEVFTPKYRYMYLKIAWHLKTYIGTKSSIDFEKLD